MYEARQDMGPVMEGLSFGQAPSPWGKGGTSMRTGLWEVPVSVLARMKAAAWVVTGAWPGVPPALAKQARQRKN